MATVYSLRYLGLDFGAAIGASNAVCERFAQRPFGKDNQRAAAWYCFFLVETGVLAPGANCTIPDPQADGNATLVDGSPTDNCIACLDDLSAVYGAVALAAQTAPLDAPVTGSCSALCDRAFRAGGSSTNGSLAYCIQTCNGVGRLAFLESANNPATATPQLCAEANPQCGAVPAVRPVVASVSLQAPAQQHSGETFNITWKISAESKTGPVVAALTYDANFYAYSETYWIESLAAGSNVLSWVVSTVVDSPPSSWPGGYYHANVSLYDGQPGAPTAAVLASAAPPVLLLV